MDIGLVIGAAPLGLAVLMALGGILVTISYLSEWELGWHYRHFSWPQSSSASRSTAGAAGFLRFWSQSRERPDRYAEPSRFDTIPSEPSLQAWQKNLRAAALRDFDPANDRYGSQADIAPSLGHVRFAPESRHRMRRSACPLSANSGQQRTYAPQQTRCLFDHLVGAQQGGYSCIPPLAVVFNLCDRRFDTRSGRMTWHLMKK
jgi:hypothetical protein